MPRIPLDEFTRGATRRSLRNAGVENPKLLEDLVTLCTHKGLSTGASAVDVAAAVGRVKAEVPGPFEPSWPGDVGLREFRRRYPDEVGSSSAFDERIERGVLQVRAALLVAGATRGGF